MVDEYSENTRRIQNALQEMRKDRSIKVTQNELAKRANVSRGTINNRGEAILKALKEIKELRKKELDTKDNVISLNSKKSLDSPLLKKSEESRLEIFYELQDTYEKIASGNKSLNSQKELIDSLKKENRELKNRLSWISQN